MYMKMRRSDGKPLIFNHIFTSLLALLQTKTILKVTVTQCNICSHLIIIMLYTVFSFCFLLGELCCSIRHVQLWAKQWLPVCWFSCENERNLVYWYYTTTFDSISCEPNKLVDHNKFAKPAKQFKCPMILIATSRKLIIDKVSPNLFS